MRFPRRSAKAKKPRPILGTTDKNPVNSHVALPCSTFVYILF